MMARSFVISRSYTGSTSVFMMRPALGDRLTSTAAGWPAARLSSAREIARSGERAVRGSAAGSLDATFVVGTVPVGAKLVVLSVGAGVTTATCWLACVAGASYEARVHTCVIPAVTSTSAAAATAG